MTIWVDAQLPPAIAPWIAASFNYDARSVRSLGLRDAEDREIFTAARIANAIVLTKDSDFVGLVALRGSPPKIILLTCGNTSNERLRAILTNALEKAMNLLEQGEDIVEISG